MEFGDDSDEDQSPGASPERSDGQATATNGTGKYVSDDTERNGQTKTSGGENLDSLTRVDSQTETPTTLYIQMEYCEKQVGIIFLGKSLNTSSDDYLLDSSRRD